jgi:hypothetical protein
MEFTQKMHQFLSQNEAIGESGNKIQLGANSMSTQNNLIAIKNLFLKLKPKKTLEIGLCHAASAILFSSLHETILNGHNCHYAMDPYQRKGWDNVGLIQLKKFDLEKYVQFYNDYSYNVLPKLLTENITFDIIYIDGSHLFENVFIDFFYSLKLLNLNGYVLLDDSTDKHVKKVIRFIKSNYAEQVKQIDTTAYIDKTGI